MRLHNTLQILILCDDEDDNSLLYITCIRFMYASGSRVKRSLSIPTIKYYRYLMIYVYISVCISLLKCIYRIHFILCNGVYQVNIYSSIATFLSIGIELLKYCYVLLTTVVQLTCGQLDVSWLKCTHFGRCSQGPVKLMKFSKLLQYWALQLM